MPNFVHIRIKLYKNIEWSYEVKLERYTWQNVLNGRLLGDDIGWRDHMVFAEVSLDTELFELVKLYWKHGLEMADHLAMTLGKRLCFITIQVSKDTEFLESEDFILGMWSWNGRQLIADTGG